MLDHAKSSNGFWVEAMTIACFIQNKIFTSTLKDITPYGASYGVKLDVSNFNIFDCLAYVHIPIELHYKLKMKLHECIFLGYGETKGHKAYKIYDKTKKIVILKRDVVFNEKLMFLKERRGDNI